MLWCVVLLLAAASAQGAVWPEKFGGFTRKSSTIPDLSQNKQLLDEFGFVAAEAAEYGSGASRCNAVAYRFKDSTGAFAFFEAQRPSAGRASKAAEMALETPGSLLVDHHNYVFQFDGRKPRPSDLKSFFATLGALDENPLPSLRRYLPVEKLVPNSQRFVLGPVSLAAFEPRIPAETAGFEFSPEARLGKYQIDGGETTLAIFAYPNAHIARNRLAEFSKLPGSSATRSGPLVAVALGGTPPASGALIDRVNYQGEVTVSDLPPPPKPTASNVAQMLLSIFTLAGLLLALCLAGGILMGVFRLGGRRFFGSKNAEEPMIVLHLADHENAMRSKG
jgi:hypothetical protein